MNNCSNTTFLGRENPTVLHPQHLVAADVNQPLWLAGAPRSRTCVQPFRNRALSPPQPRTRAWMPSFVTWSHQEIFSCSSSGHPSLGRRKEKRVAAFLLYKDILLRGRTRNSPVLGPTRALMHTHTPRGTLPRQTPPGVSSFPEALSGALEQGIRRAKQGQRTPFWAPPHPTHTVYALSGPKHNQTAQSQSQKSGCSPCCLLTFQI